MKIARLFIATALLLGSAPSWATGLMSVSNNIVTPNGDGFNDQVRITIDNPMASILEGRLYDMNGHEIATLNLDSSGTSTTLSWDGRSSGGAAVESGVYIYQITGASSRIAGVVAVAR